MWTSLYLSAGTELAGRSFPMFDVAQGKVAQCGRTFGLTDTNMREAGRTQSGVAYNCTHASWLVREAAGPSSLDQLAQAYGRSMVDLIQEHGTLSWDFTQVRIDIAPLWLDSIPQLVTIPGSQTFRIILAFGKGAPKLDLDHVVRLTLQGQFKHSIDFG